MASITQRDSLLRMIKVNISGSRQWMFVQLKHDQLDRVNSLNLDLKLGFVLAATSMRNSGQRADGAPS